MKVKLIVVLMTVAAVFVGAVLWRTDSFVYGDRMSWVEAQTRTQLGAINHSLAVELKSLQRIVANLSSEDFQKGKTNWTALSPYYALGAFTVRGNELEPQVLVTRENSKAASWSKEFVKAAIGRLTERGNDLRFFVKPFQDSQRGRYVALVFLEGSKAYVLFGSGEIFQSLIDAQKGSLSAFSIVTSGGLTVGHSVPEYLGTVMRDDPVFKEAQKAGSSHGSSVFKLSSGQELFGMYEMIPQSNLLVLSSAPLSVAMKGRSGLWWQFLLLGAGLLLVGAAAALWIVIPAEKKIEDLEVELQEAKSRPLMATAVPEKVVLPDPVHAQKEKMAASVRVASALAHEMRGPLASILGYSQMILARHPEDEIVQSTESILRETRAARGVLDKLLGFAGEVVREKVALRVDGPLARALKEMEPLFSQKGVKVVKKLGETQVRDMDMDAVTKAISNILMNSVEAMERMARKEIKIDLHEEEDGTHLVIEDCGEGIEPGNIEKIFDPFFSTRSFQNHMGLGLPVAFGVLKEHNADIRFESERGKGTKVVIVFKKAMGLPVMQAPVAPPPEAEEIVMQELPVLKDESQHRVEAEKSFIESQEVESASPASPLDVNIEDLLEELPEAVEAKLETEKKIAKEMVPQSSAAPVDNELTFIDGFLEKDVAEEEIEVQEDALLEVAEGEALTTVDLVGPKVKPGQEEATPPMDANLAATGEMTELNFIGPPKAPARKKVSRLDSFQVEIRRPGKRI